MQLYRKFASLLLAIDNCEKAGNTEWADRHAQKFADLMNQYMPDGSGFNSGTELDDSSRPDRLIFTTTYYHSDEHGSITSCTDHKIIITPSLVYSYNMRVTGRNKNDIKSYITDLFTDALDTEIEKPVSY